MKKLVIVTEGKRVSRAGFIPCIVLTHSSGECRTGKVGDGQQIIPADFPELFG
jgi:hypothetical protein